jgi:ADP-ribosylglycohydrolase
MLTRKQLAENPAYCRDKALGCLAGLAIGDSLGDQARSPENHSRYGITREFHDTANQSTDDTEFALLTAVACMEARDDLTPEVLVEMWRCHVLVVPDLGPKAGIPLHGAAENLRRGILPPHSGSDNCDNYDDGAAMRVAPIGVICAGDPARAARWAAADASISHAQDGLWGAQAIAASIAVAMVDGSIDEIIDAGMALIPEDSWLGRWMARSRAICNETGDLKRAWNRLHDELWTAVRCSNPEALAQTYALFRLTEGDFANGVVAAANFGRDADTLAALVGALAGARYGASTIPKDWIEKTRRPSGQCLPFTASLDIVEVASKLADLII